MARRSAKIGGGGGGGGAFVFGAFAAGNNPTPLHLVGGGGNPNAASATAYNLPVDRAISIARIAVSQIPGTGSAVYRYELWTSTAGAAFVASGKFVDIGITNHFEAATFGTPFAAVEGMRVAVLVSRFSGTLIGGTGPVSATLHFTG